MITRWEVFFILCDAKKLFKNLPKNDFGDLNMCHFPWISFDELKKYLFTIFFLLFKGLGEGLIGDQKSDIYTRNRSNNLYFKNKIIKYYIFSWKNILFYLVSGAKINQTYKIQQYFVSFNHQKVCFCMPRTILSATKHLVSDKIILFSEIWEL